MKLFIIENWVEKYSQKLYNRAFYLLGNRSDAEDLVQDIFVIAYEKKEQYKGKSSPLTWLMSILNNKIADAYRQKYKSGTKISLDHFFDNDGFWNAPDEILKEWDFPEPYYEEKFEDYLERCLQLLPQKWLLVIKLTYLQEQKSNEICQEMHITKTNYWKILQRCRLQLRECIEQKFY